MYSLYFSSASTADGCCEKFSRTENSCSSVGQYGTLFRSTRFRIVWPSSATANGRLPFVDSIKLTFASVDISFRSASVRAVFRAAWPPAVWLDEVWAPATGLESWKPRWKNLLLKSRSSLFLASGSVSPRICCTLLFKARLRLSPPADCWYQLCSSSLSAVSRVASGVFSRWQSLMYCFKWLEFLQDSRNSCLSPENRYSSYKPMLSDDIRK